LMESTDSSDYAGAGSDDVKQIPAWDRFDVNCTWREAL
jgi:hypothetical protein